MMSLFLILFRTANSQIYSLEENIICNDILCDQGTYANNLYNYGQEDFGDLTGSQFSLQFFIRADDEQIAALIGQGFIASIMDGSLVVLDLIQDNLNSFTITSQGVATALSSFQSTSWYQIYFTESQIFISDWSQTLNYAHSITFSSSHRFNFFTQSSLSFWTGQACCIIMYKGILVDNTYFNSQLYIQSNTKYPETIIDINIQEKLQSNITNDYSDYQHIVRLGNSFDFDYSDPYLLDDSLLFNGSQYLNAYDVYLNYQYTLEYRIKLTSLTQNIQLFNFQQLSYYLRVQLKPSLIVEFDLNGQTSQFTLQSQSQLHFCIAIIYYLDDIRLQYSIQFIQFSNTGILAQQSYYKQSPTQFQNGQGTVTIGSSLNQFNTGEYFELYHFRFYQGYFIDDKSVIDPLCQIYLNDRCIICKPGHLLQDNNQCLNQCSQLQQITYFNTQNNQCIRQCHTTCATCSISAICLTCSGNRINPPNCDCPNGYFDDFVSPNCRKYFQDIQTQTGQQLIQCSTLGNLCSQINFNYKYNSVPQVGIFLIGASQNLGTTKSNMLVNQVTNNNFQICVYCDSQKQFFQVQWMSSIGDAFYKAQEGDQSNMNSQLFILPITVYQNQIPYPQILGWKQQIAGTSFQIDIQNQLSTSFQVSSQNPLDFIKYNVVYTNFLTIQYSYATENIQSLDNIPKSIKMVSIFQGLQTNNNTGTFKQMISSRSLNYGFSMNGYILFTAQQCQTGTCNFYEQYLSTCNLNFELCSCNEINYFINSNNECQKCDDNCQKCSGLSTQCTQCYPYQDKQLVNGQCVCGVKKYLDSNSICQNCDILCQSCTSSSPNCQSCIMDSQLQNEVCECNPGRYLDLILQSCQICHINCKTCIGQPINQCLSCDQDKVYNTQLMICQCRDSQFLDQNYQCSDCHSTCTTCISNSSTDCLSCGNFRSLVVNYSNDAHECQCKSGYFQDENGICQKCQSRCSECQNDSTCIKCTENRTLDSNTQQCLCNNGYFEQSDQLICIKCPFNCSQCLNQKQCISCLNNSELNNFLCLCKQGFYLQNYICISCNTETGSSQLSCYNQVCGDGVKTQQEQCDDGNQLDGDGCNILCQLEFGYYYQNGLIVQNTYPKPYLIESYVYQQLYNPLRIFQLYYIQELQYFELDMEQFIEIVIKDKLIKLDFTLLLMNQSEYDKGLLMRINITIQLNLQTTFEDQQLVVYFKNPKQIKTSQGFEQQSQFVHSEISDYVQVDQRTRTITDDFSNTTYYMLYLILGLVILSLLTGGIEIFYNLLDLLQVISYLQYVNTQFPYNLETYLNLFSFLQIKILDDYIDFSKYFVDYDQLYISPTKINDDCIAPNIIVNLSSYIFVWIMFFGTLILAHIIPFIIKFIQVDIKQQDIKSINLQYKTFILIIKQFVVKQCKVIQNQFIYSGLFRTYLSTAYDFCFYLQLNLYFLSFNDYEVNEIASYLTVMFITVYFIIFTQALNVVQLKSFHLVKDQQKYGSIYEGLKLKHRYYKYYNLFLLLKRLLFMIYLVLPYSDPLFQITGLISLQIIQVIFILMKPIKEQFEENKQTLCEILMLIIEISIFILVIDDFFNFTDRPVIGWICIVLITILLASQIIFDSLQQWKIIRKIYNKFQKYIQQQIKQNQQQLNHENLLIQV
ncbi:hypothetical protein pb186bvf_014412 [Paramecium bursaria]